jgi:hypothetical protein
VSCSFELDIAPNTAELTRFGSRQFQLAEVLYPLAFLNYYSAVALVTHILYSRLENLFVFFKPANLEILVQLLFTFHHFFFGLFYNSRLL